MAETAKRWSAASGQGLRAFEGHDLCVSSAAFSPDGRDRQAVVYGPGESLRTIVSHEDCVTSAALSPDGQQALTASVDEIARLCVVCAL